MTGATNGGAGGYSEEGSQTGAIGTIGGSHPGTSAGRPTFVGPH